MAKILRHLARRLDQAPRNGHFPSHRAETNASAEPARELISSTAFQR